VTEKASRLDSQASLRITLHGYRLSSLYRELTLEITFFARERQRAAIASRHV
jgi:hypothetical protein